MISKRIVLHFPRNLIDKPIISHLVKKFDLEFNILQAKITPDEEGLMVLELKGKKENYAEGVNFLKKQGVTCQLLSQDIRLNEKRCIQCGACITVCPTGALYIDKKTMEVKFDINNCTACELCVKACPARAMEVKLKEK